MSDKIIVISDTVADDLINSYEPFVNDHTKCAVSATRFFAFMRAVGESRAKDFKGFPHVPPPGTIGLVADMIEWIGSKIRAAKQ